MYHTLSGDGEHMCNKLFNQPLIHEEPHNMPMISIWGQGKANSTFWLLSLNTKQGCYWLHLTYLIWCSKDWIITPASCASN